MAERTGKAKQTSTTSETTSPVEPSPGESVERDALARIRDYQWGWDGPSGHPLARVIADMQRIAESALKT